MLNLNKHSAIFLQGNAVILGAPGSGKTTIAKEIAAMNPEHILVHTDDFTAFGYEESLYALIKYLKTLTQPFIVEGVLGYRLLRKGLENQDFYPEHIITVTAPEARLLQVYHDRGKDIKKVQSMVKGNETVWQKYMDMLLTVPDGKLPTLHHYDNT